MTQYAASFWTAQVIFAQSVPQVHGLSEDCAVIITDTGLVHVLDPGFRARRLVISVPGMHKSQPSRNLCAALNGADSNKYAYAASAKTKYACAPVVLHDLNAGAASHISLPSEALCMEFVSRRRSGGDRMGVQSRYP